MEERFRQKNLDSLLIDYKAKRRLFLGVQPFKGFEKTGPYLQVLRYALEKRHLQDRWILLRRAFHLRGYAQKNPKAGI